MYQGHCILKRVDQDENQGDRDHFFTDRFMFVRIHTDNGLTGIGESGAFMHLGASAQIVETFKRYLIGKAPLRIEHH